MAFSRCFATALLTLLSIFLSSPSLSFSKKHYKPCKTLTVYFHETLYNGTNSGDATSAIVAAPHGASLLALADQFYFGDVIVFDNPVTVGASPRSEVVGSVQGLYTFTAKNTFTAWHSFSFFFNSTQHRGTVQIMGLNPLLSKVREISAVGGTGDFFMHRGIATFTTVAVEWKSYYMLRVEIMFYECW